MESIYHCTYSLIFPEDLSKLRCGYLPNMWFSAWLPFKAASKKSLTGKTSISLCKQGNHSIKWRNNRTIDACYSTGCCVPQGMLKAHLCSLGCEPTCLWVQLLLSTRTRRIIGPIPSEWFNQNPFDQLLRALLGLSAHQEIPVNMASNWISNHLTVNMLGFLVSQYMPARDPTSLAVSTVPL